MKAKFLFAALAAFAASNVAATPSVFISPTGGSAWWVTKSITRPMQKSIDGISVESLNAFRAKSETAPDDICFAEALTRSSVVGLDRQSQLEIEKTLNGLPHDPFRREFTTPGGDRHVALAAIYQECDGTIGGLFLVKPAGRAEIELLTIYADDPLTFLWPGSDAALVGLSGCFECGDWTSLYYDVTRRKFYLEYEGD